MTFLIFLETFGSGLHRVMLLQLEERTPNAFVTRKGICENKKELCSQHRQQNLTQPSSNTSRGGILPDQGDEKIS